MKCSLPELSLKPLSPWGQCRETLGLSSPRGATGLRLTQPCSHQGGPAAGKCFEGLLEGIKSLQQWDLFSLQIPSQHFCNTGNEPCSKESQRWVSGDLQSSSTAPAGTDCGLWQCLMAAPALPFPLDGHYHMPVLLSMKFPWDESLISDNECFLAHLKILLSGVVLLYDFSET